MEHAAMFVHEEELLDAVELPFDVSSRAEGLSWVETPQQRRVRHIYSICSVLLKEIARDRVG